MNKLSNRRFPITASPQSTQRNINCCKMSWYFYASVLLLVTLFPFPVVGKDISVVSSRSERLHLYNDYYALVIGVSNYEKRPVLPHAVKDARELSSFLQRMGFKVTVVIDPTSQQLKKAFSDLVMGPGREPERGIVVYYAGHGETQPMPDGTRAGWIIPRDCPLFEQNPTGFTNSAVSMKDIVTYSVDIQSRHVMMFFDALFSGASFSLESPVLSVTTEKNSLPARQYLIAGKEGESIPEHGVFLQSLLKGLEGDADMVADGIITGSELGVYLQHRVEEVSGGKQHPQYGKINVPALAGGDFVFQQIQSRSETATLSIKTEPEDARVNILNIKTRFSQGMELKPGKYHVEVTAKGYQTGKNWITLAAGEDRTIDIRLKKIGNVITNSLAMKFVFINPGTFLMGSAANVAAALQDEQQHSVTVSKGYYLQATEVTVAQFRQFVVATGYKTEAETSGGCWINTAGGGWKRKKESNWKSPGSWETAAFRQTDEQPVTCVSWNDAQAFIKWLSEKEGKVYVLPTEAEWEYACRAGTTTPFAFGKCLSSDQANYAGIDEQFANCKDSYRKNNKKPLKVASLAPNPWGLFDMHGNVAEWCQDWYGNFPARAVTDPKGPFSGADRVFRGCHWLNTASECRSAKRASFPPDSASDAIGFRLIMRP